MLSVKNFQKKKLKNGITILYEKRDLPVVSFSISNPFAASHETAKIKGIAHFIEHMLFTGTKNRTHEDIAREVEKKGGMLNAYTAQDVTSYLFKLPSEHLFSGIEILTDLMNNPLFSPDKFEKERKVILEEIKMYHDMPQQHVYEQLLKNLYEKPFGIGIIGTTNTVSNLTRDFVYDYYLKIYSPENYIVSMVGNADFDKVCKFIEKSFKKKGNFIKTQRIRKKNTVTVEKRDGIDQAHFVFGFHAPMHNDKKIYALEVLDAYLANGMSSYLFLEIREKRGLAYSVKSSINAEKNYSYYSIYVGTKKHSIKEVQKLILQGFKHASENMTNKQLLEAKNRLIGLKKITSEESINVMNELLFEELVGDAKNYYKHDQEIKKVTLNDVKKIAKIGKFSTAAIIPK